MNTKNQVQNDIFIKAIFSFLMSKTTLLLVALGCWLHLCCGQKRPFEAYSESIPGSTLTIKMLPIPSGGFLMGSPETEKGRKNDESPERKVDIDPFWMASYETTWDLYRLFMAREIDKKRPNPSKGNEVLLDVDAIGGATTPYVEMSFGMGTEGYPAICMTQYAALKFCEWLSAMTGNFYRLPTEAEWEYAARAGTQTPYSFGASTSNIDEYAWYNGNSNGKYHKVGLKKPNPWGLYDMHGNVAEWTLDQYLDYNAKKTKNPWAKPMRTYPRVVRGGSWKNREENLRSASRMPSKADWKMRDPQIPKSKWWLTDAPFVGFRIVRPYKTPGAEEQKNYWKAKHSK